MPSDLDIPVWVLNLERDVARLEFMTQQLSSLNVDFDVVKAVDKHKLGPEEWGLYSKRKTLRIHNRELSPGELACALSHANIWSRIVAERHREVLILEDDVKVGMALVSVLQNRHRFPKDYELINFSTDAAQEPFGEFVSDIYRISRHLDTPNRTSAYLITLDGATKLLRHTYPICAPSDGLTAAVGLTHVASYGIYPRVAVVVDQFASSIWQDEADIGRYQPSALGKIKGLLRFRFRRLISRIRRISRERFGL
jgi:glycosyl transferase family 25